ncbi:unnamed protein product [Cladocopium goreaui]|uniref:Fungal lipase-like domain-containing protein n=1 Tax=Cladocopium goreaui TaxID=2562237 RepID=A0A9P1G1G2_9DINO|nr:unnamed protein product [Cladocopium goreaui]
MAVTGGEDGGEKHAGTDIEALEGALIDWINTCCPEADVEEFDDLADGAILADVLQLYAPDVDPTNSAAGSAKRLHSCLSSYFGERIELPRLAGNMHNGAFCKPKLLRSLTEAVLLAAVEGPQKEEAVQAIMNLDENKQMALGNALQRLMAHSEAADSKEEILETGESNPPTPRAPSGVSEYKSSADVLQDEIQEMKHQCKSEMIAVDSLENSEKALQAQLRAIMADFAAEEEQAAETMVSIQKWQRLYGDEMRQRKAECSFLQQELQKEAENAKDLPQLQSKLQLQLDQELHACREMKDNTEYLDVEFREAAQSNEKDDLSTVKAEMMASQMQQEEEKEQMHIAKGLWENLHMTEVAASMHDNTLRQVRRVAEKEEETEADVLGLLEFRECEMRQLELSLGESGTAGGQMGNNRASIAGPGAELLHSAPDMAELRSLLKELGQIARKHGTAQTELSQQQQRTRDLAHRLQQLEDESAQHQNSEAMALAEFRTRREEELHYSSELHERSHSQSMPPAAGTASAKTSGADVPKGADGETAELQTRLVSLRSRAATMLKEENEAATKLAKMQQEENEAAAKLSKLQQEEKEAATRLSETQQEEKHAATKLMETQQEENQAATRLSETRQAISKTQEAQAQARLKRQAVKQKATSKVEEAMSANEPKKEHERLGKEEADSSKKGHQKVEDQARLNVNRSEATSQKEDIQSARLSETLKVIAKAEAATDLASAKEHAKQARQQLEDQARLNVNRSEATSQKEDIQSARLSETLKVIAKAEAATDLASAKEHAKQARQQLAEEQAPLNVNRSEATSQKKGEKPTAKRFELPKASKEPAAKGQRQLEVKAEAQKAEPNKEDQDADAKNNKALLRKLRQQLAEEERKLRQWDTNQMERRQAMHLETQLISDSIREIGTRCQMLVDKHRALLDDRKRLESEA